MFSHPKLAFGMWLSLKLKTKQNKGLTLNSFSSITVTFSEGKNSVIASSVSCAHAQANLAGNPCLDNFDSLLLLILNLLELFIPYKQRIPSFTKWDALCLMKYGYAGRMMLSRALRSHRVACGLKVSLWVLAQLCHSKVTCS